MPPSRLTLFTLLFAWANLLHQLSYPAWIKGLQPLGWLLFLVSIAAAIRPSCFRVFVALISLRILYSISWMPMLRGHLFLEGLFTLAILAGLILRLRRLGKFGPTTIQEEQSLF